MSDAAIIKRTRTPATIQSLEDDFSRLGVAPGMIILTNSLDSIDWDWLAQNRGRLSPDDVEKCLDGGQKFTGFRPTY
jgi:hypothetical protein